MPRRVQLSTAAFSYDVGPGDPPDLCRCRALEAVEEAGRKGADIVCLPEFSAAVRGGPSGYLAEAIPGPTTELFAEPARRHGMYVLVPLFEASGGEKGWNTTVLLGRDGGIVGRYRKTHLCLPGHGEGQTTLAGDEVVVLETDFARIGIATCMDIHYPELFMAMALGGAEVIFFPTACIDYTGDLIESLINARAADNQVWFVSSHYAAQPFLVGRTMGRSRVVDCMGRTRADTGHFPGVAIAEVDLDETYPMWYTGAMLEQYPTMRETLFRTRRPELYGALTEPLREGHWRRG
ncbi:MAG: carbon-nitrogen hydrolase family protein [Armatimonadetes bacterium]|nr:carbon-nitrogen hydrolase family protein [Armatimonadota bacterium]